jgi:hypothetical protein
MSSGDVEPVCERNQCKEEETVANTFSKVPLGDLVPLEILEMSIQ